MKRVLITGAAGFIGSHLLEHCAAQGLQAWGTTRRPAEGPLLRCDLLQPQQLGAVLRRVRPDVVFHLAAQSLPSLSWLDPVGTMEANVLGTLRLLEAVRGASVTPRIVIVGSSAEYGAGAAREPLPEDSPLLPVSPYGLSKVLQGQVAAFYGRVHGLRVLRVRPFSIIGPRKTHDACSDFARGIVAVECGDAPSLTVGNLEAVRDFLDVEDAVRALLLLAEAGEEAGVYNLSSGVGTTVGGVLAGLIALARTPVRLETAAERRRPLDEPFLVGDSSRLRRLGWQPQVPLATSLERVLDYWRTVRQGHRAAAEAVR